MSVVMTVATNGLNEYPVYTTLIDSLCLHRVMETYEVDEHGYPTALGCYQLMRAIIDKMPRPEIGSAEYTHYSNAMYALGYINSALKVVKE